MPEKPPSSPEIDISAEQAVEQEREPDAKESVEIYWNAAGFDTHPKITPERRKRLKAYMLWNDGAWRHADGRNILVTDIDVHPDRVIVTGEAFGQEFKDEIPE